MNAGSGDHSVRHHGQTVRHGIIASHQDPTLLLPIRIVMSHGRRIPGLAVVHRVAFPVGNCYHGAESQSKSSSVGRFCCSCTGSVAVDPAYAAAAVRNQCRRGSDRETHDAALGRSHALSTRATGPVPGEKEMLVNTKNIFKVI